MAAWTDGGSTAVLAYGCTSVHLYYSTGVHGGSCGGAGRRLAAGVGEGVREVV
jgi:hypothetical protein